MIQEFEEFIEFANELVSEAKTVFPHWWDEQIDYLEEANKTCDMISNDSLYEETSTVAN